MAKEHQKPRQQQPPTALPSHQAHPVRVTTVHRRRVRRLLRWRKVHQTTVRLGGKKPKRRRLFGLMRIIFRRMRLRWLKLQYLRVLKRLKEQYRNLVKDLVEAGATIETFQHRLFMETSLATVSFGVTLSSYPSHFGSDRPRTIFM